MESLFIIFTFITLFLHQGITCHPLTPSTLQNNKVGFRHYSNQSMEILHKLNLSTLILATRDARIGGAIISYLRERRNRTLWRRRRRNNHTYVAVQHLVKNEAEAAVSASAEESDEDYEDYEDDYPDFDFTPASIFIYVLEIFGTLIGLTWGAIATLFTAG